MKNSKIILSVLCIFILSVTELSAQDSKLRFYSVSAGVGIGTFNTDFPKEENLPILSGYNEGINITADIAFKSKNTMYSFFMEFGKNDQSHLDYLNKRSYEGFSITIGRPVGKKKLVFEPNIGVGYYFYHEIEYSSALDKNLKYNESRFGGTLRLKLLVYPTPKFGFGANGNVFLGKGFSNFNINLTIQYRFK